MAVKTHAKYEEELFDREIDLVPLEPYIKGSIPILHECFKGHIVRVRPDDLLKRKRCPKCSLPGLNYKSSALLYLVSFLSESGRLYKIGITTKTIKERYGPEWNALNMELIWAIPCIDAHTAFNLEQQLKLKYSDYLITCTTLRTGNTEVLSTVLPKPEGLSQPASGVNSDKRRTGQRC